MENNNINLNSNKEKNLNISSTNKKCFNKDDNVHNISDNFKDDNKSVNLFLRKNDQHVDCPEIILDIEKNEHTVDKKGKLCIDSSDKKPEENIKKEHQNNEHDMLEKIHKGNHIDNIFSDNKNEINFISEENKNENILNKKKYIYEQDTTYGDVYLISTEHNDTHINKDKDKIFTCNEHNDAHINKDKDKIFTCNEHNDAHINKDKIFICNEHNDAHINKDKIFTCNENNDAHINKDKIFTCNEHNDAHINKDKIFTCNEHNDAHINKDKIFTCNEHNEEKIIIQKNVEVFDKKKKFNTKDKEYINTINNKNCNIQDNHHDVSYEKNMLINENVRNINDTFSKTINSKFPKEEKRNEIRKKNGSNQKTNINNDMVYDINEERTSVDEKIEKLRNDDILKSEDILKNNKILSCDEEGEEEKNDLSLEEILYETTERSKSYNRKNYGLLGILKVIKMTDPNLNILAIGSDLTTLGLNLNSPNYICTSVSSPFSENPIENEEDFIKPISYLNTKFQIRLSLLLKLQTETLFYIFYNLPRDVLQAYAASELYIRKWIYHIIYKKWFTPNNTTSTINLEKCASWIYFDPLTWSKKTYNNYLNVKDDIMNVEDVTKCIEQIIKLQSYYNIHQQNI
ncbi:CCR4-NOT transcription complex subunit 2, putative [Plasmodium reichenowi]|uniref:CCR4-NOT transcription complex subunit 2, putative n=1 Tax=Plasmodium reichenowi TaxID=5854 RepID=A0A2P9DGS2_PLARE|nr:CCR4-NOT transcription complex subunit 2, putative [Plasmodium reichenowi]